MQNLGHKLENNNKKNHIEIALHKVDIFNWNYNVFNLIINTLVVCTTCTVCTLTFRNKKNTTQVINLYTIFFNLHNTFLNPLLKFYTA